MLGPTPHLQLCQLVLLDLQRSTLRCLHLLHVLLQLLVAAGEVGQQLRDLRLRLQLLLRNDRVLGSELGYVKGVCGMEEYILRGPAA